MDEDKRRVLLYSESWGTGGIESFVMNAIRALAQEPEYICDVFSTHDSNSGYDAEIREHGGGRYCIFKGYRPNLLKRTIVSAICFNALLKRHHYDVVHINTMNGMGFMYTAIAKHHGVPCRIVHSHNSAFGEGGRAIKSVAHNFGKSAFGGSVTARLACSQAAGEYLFDAKPFVVIKNSIDIDRFRFDVEARDEVRRQLDVPTDAFVFGTVGRLESVKNPLFLVDVLAGLRSSGRNAVLVLVGEGSLRDEITAKTKKLGVSDAVHMPGKTPTPERFLSAMDVFCMPSLFEGAPFSAIEAAANGVPELLSTNIPTMDLKHVPVTYLPLDVDAWIRELSAAGVHADVERTAAADVVGDQGYSFKSLHDILINCYRNR